MGCGSGELEDLIPKELIIWLGLQDFMLHRGTVQEHRAEIKFRGWSRREGYDIFSASVASYHSRGIRLFVM